MLGQAAQTTDGSRSRGGRDPSVSGMAHCCCNCLLTTSRFNVSTPTPPPRDTAARPARPETRSASPRFLSTNISRHHPTPSPPTRRLMQPLLGSEAHVDSRPTPPGPAVVASASATPSRSRPSDPSVSAFAHVQPLSSAHVHLHDQLHQQAPSVSPATPRIVRWIRTVPFECSDPRTGSSPSSSGRSATKLPPGRSEPAPISRAAAPLFPMEIGPLFEKSPCAGVQEPDYSEMSSMPGGEAAALTPSRISTDSDEHFPLTWHHLMSPTSARRRDSSSPTARYRRLGSDRREGLLSPGQAWVSGQPSQLIRRAPQGMSKVVSSFLQSLSLHDKDKDLDDFVQSPQTAPQFSERLPTHPVPLALNSRKRRRVCATYGRFSQAQRQEKPGTKEQVLTATSKASSSLPTVPSGLNSYQPIHASPKMTQAPAQPVASHERPQRKTRTSMRAASAAASQSQNPDCRGPVPEEAQHKAGSGASPPVWKKQGVGGRARRGGATPRASLRSTSVARSDKDSSARHPLSDDKRQLRTETDYSHVKSPDGVMSEQCKSVPDPLPAPSPAPSPVPSSASSSAPLPDPLPTCAPVTSPAPAMPPVCALPPVPATRPASEPAPASIPCSVLPVRASTSSPVPSPVPPLPSTSKLELNIEQQTHDCSSVWRRPSPSSPLMSAPSMPGTEAASFCPHDVDHDNQYAHAVSSGGVAGRQSTQQEPVEQHIATAAGPILSDEQEGTKVLPLASVFLGTQVDQMDANRGASRPVSADRGLGHGIQVEQSCLKESPSNSNPSTWDAFHVHHLLVDGRTTDIPRPSNSEVGGWHVGTSDVGACRAGVPAMDASDVLPSARNMEYPAIDGQGSNNCTAHGVKVDVCKPENPELQASRVDDEPDPFSPSVNTLETSVAEASRGDSGGENTVPTGQISPVPQSKARDLDQEGGKKLHVEGSPADRDHAVALQMHRAEPDKSVIATPAFSSISKQPECEPSTKAGSSFTFPLCETTDSWPGSSIRPPGPDFGDEHVDEKRMVGCFPPSGWAEGDCTPLCPAACPKAQSPEARSLSALLVDHHKERRRSALDAKEILDEPGVRGTSLPAGRNKENVPEPTEVGPPRIMMGHGTSWPEPGRADDATAIGADSATDEHKDQHRPSVDRERAGRWDRWWSDAPRESGGSEPRATDVDVRAMSEERPSSESEDDAWTEAYEQEQLDLWETTQDEVILI